MAADFRNISSKNTSLIKHRTVKINSEGANRDDILSPLEIKDILDRLKQDEHESKEIKLSVVRKLTADMTERGRKLGSHLESIHGYVVKDCSNMEESQDNCLSEELADEIRKRTTSVDSEIKQLENQMGQLQRTLVKGKARRESIRHRISASSPGGGRKVSTLSSCSSMPEDEELTTEDYKAKIEILEKEKVELLEEKKDLSDEIKFLKYQLQYRLEVQSLQNESNGKMESHVKLENENKTLREENTKLKERFSTLKKKLEESGHVEETLLNITDVPDAAESSVLIESELDRMYTERKILLSTIMRMQNMEKDVDENVSFADFGVQCDLLKKESTEEKDVTPLVAKLTKENKALKKHITDMQNEIDEREEESKTLDEENYKLTEEKRTLEDTINKLRTQINETLDTTLDEIEHLHSFNEDLELKFKRTEAKHKEISQTLKDLQNRNCKALENILDEVENKSTLQEVFDYLDRAVGRLAEENCSINVESSERKPNKEKNEEKQFTSNLLNEVKTCKELLESQRSHIRNLQLDKRDIEEGYTKMKRELLLLKSNKQRARENSKELQFLKRRAKSLNDGTLGGIETKDVLVDKESLQREVKRLGAVKSQLENSVQKLKNEKATLDDEKVCLLGSLYHQLERNESLEMQIEELTAALEQWEAKADLENDVFERNDVKKSNDDKVREEDKSETEKTELDSTYGNKEFVQLSLTLDEESLVSSTSNDQIQGIMKTSSNKLDTENTESLRPTSPVVSVVSSTTEESLQEMKQKIHALGEQLQQVQESVCELETERDKLQEDLEESKKNEKELRNVIIQLKRENSLHLDKLTKSNELVETLQVRLREAKEAKEEAMESLEEANKENFVSKRHSEVLDNRLQDVTKQRDEVHNEIGILKEKAKKDKENLKEIHKLVDEVNKVSLKSDVEDIFREGKLSEFLEKSEDDLHKESIVGLRAIINKAKEMKEKLQKKFNEYDILRNRLDTLYTEKEVLQKSVREIDDKKKQMKGFITKLTEEKEKVTEQLDEMRQQKSSLADALENVYQSKEKLQNRYGEALCKQEQYKKSLSEALDEAKTLKESLYRVVSEHETMKESLLTANREVERLKSEHQVYHKRAELNVIPEEEDKEFVFKQDQNKNEIEENPANLKQEIDRSQAAGSAKTDKPLVGKIYNTDREELLGVVDKLKESVSLLSREKCKFEAQMERIKSYKDLTNEKDHRQDSVCQESINTYKSDKSDIKQEQAGQEISAIQMSRDKIISELNNQVVQLEIIMGQVTSQLQDINDKLEDQETISGLIQMQQDLLGNKQDIEKRKDLVEDKEHLMEWFEVISAEKENLEKELQAASKDNMELVQDLEKLREEKEKLRHQLESILNVSENDQKENKDVESTGKNKAPEAVRKEPQEDDMPAKHQEEKSKKNVEELCDVINELEITIKEKVALLNSKEIEKEKLIKLTEKLQEDNKSLNDQFVEFLEKSKHFRASEKELEKSIRETEALEKQVEVLSNEGASLKGEADERVQRLMELEEKMIVTMENKLELAEYAKSLKSKKESLEKKCEQLSLELEGLKTSRDQLLAGKLELAETFRAEIKTLKLYKEKSIKEIEKLNKVLKIEKQDFEAIKIELDSMQRKNKVLKQDLEKMKLKDARAAEEEQKLSKENKELKELMSDVIILFDKEITGKDLTSIESCKTMEDKKKKVFELKEWIINVIAEMKDHANERKFLNSFVQDVDVKLSDVLKKEELENQADSGQESEVEFEFPQNKESYENINCKLDILIQKLKESFQHNTSLQNQLGQITEDNERIFKELTSKSNFLQTMRVSFEQLLQERNLLAQKATEETVKLRKEKLDIEIDGDQDIQYETSCNICKKLEKERNDLNLKILSMNKESTELVDKCHRLKEQLILLKQQQDNKSPEEDDICEKTNLDPWNSNETEGVQHTVEDCHYVPEFESKLETEEKTTDSTVETECEKTFYKEQTEKLEKQLDKSLIEKADLETLLALSDGRSNGPHSNHTEDKLQLELSKYREKNESLVNDLKLMENNIKEIMHQHQRETTELKKEIQQLENELNDSKKGKEEIETLMTGLRSELEHFKSDQLTKPQNTEMQKSADSDNDERVKLHKTLAERSNSLKNLNEKLSVSKNFMQKILDENIELKENVVILETDVKDMLNEKEVLKAEIDIKKRALLQAKEQSSITENKNIKLEEGLASLKEQVRSRGSLLTTLEKDKETFKVSLREAQNEVGALLKQNAELTDLFNSGEQRRMEMEKLVKKLKQSCDEMTAKFEKASTENKINKQLLTEELENEKVKNEKLKTKLEKLEKDNAGLKTNYEKTKEKIEQLTQELRKDKARKDREMGNVKQENAKLLADEERADREVDSLRRQLDDERNKNEHLEEDLNEAKKENKSLKKTLQLESDENLKTNEEMKENEKEGRRLSTLTGDIKTKVQNLDALINALKKENKVLEEESNRAKEVNKNLRIRLVEANEDKEELEKIIDEMREKRKKLYDEIDNALAERDDFEDELVDTKQQMNMKIESLVKEKTLTDEKLELLKTGESSLRKELEEYGKTNAILSEENQNLKDDLKKARTELNRIQTRESLKKSTAVASSQEKEEYIRKLKEGQYEIKKLTCALEKSKKELKKLKAVNENLKESKSDDKKPDIVREDIVIREGMALESLAVDYIDKRDDYEEPLSLKEQISKYMIENMRLRAQLEESVCKLITLQDELYRLSKEGVHGECKMDTIQRECQTLRDMVRKYSEVEESLKTRLQASNNAQAELRKRLRNAIADKEKFEKECKKLILEKGLVEKVTVTSIEVPEVFQVEVLDREHLAKAQSLESARKEIVILESQVKDLSRQSESQRQLVKRALSDIITELSRASKLLALFTEGNKEDFTKLNEKRKTKDMVPDSTTNEADDGLEQGISDLRNAVDRLEDNAMKTGDQNTFNEMIRELDNIRGQRNVLNDKLIYLQDKLNKILEERQVLEDIGADTRKELAALVECLSSERGEKMSISSEHSDMQAKLSEADKNEKLLLSKLSYLEQQCEKLNERNRLLEIKYSSKIKKQEELIFAASDENLVECSPTVKEVMENEQSETGVMEKHKSFKSLCKDYCDLSTACDKLESRNEILEEEKKLMVEEVYAYKKKLDSQNQDLLVEIKTKDQELKNNQADISKLLLTKKKLDSQVRHLDREVMLLKDRVVCVEAEKERIEDANRRQQSEIQELFLHKSQDYLVRQKLENLFYENTKLKEQKRMLVARLQSLERDVKSQLLTIRDFENEKEELHIRLENNDSEKRKEESQKNLLLQLLDQQKEDSRKDISDLSEMVEKLTREKDELCKKNPQLNNMLYEKSRLEEENVNKEVIIDKLKEESVTLTKENNLLRRACEKLKESRRSSQRLRSTSLERSFTRLSPSHISGSRQSSFSSFDQTSLSNSHHSFSEIPEKSKDSAEFCEYIQQTPPKLRMRTPISDGQVTNEADTTSICSQECYCSPILSVVNLRPFDIQQPTDISSSQCPKCNRQKKSSVVISEHYV